MNRDTKKMIDKSYLSADKTDERGVIHRDLIAHAFRWSYAARLLIPFKSTPVVVYDVGCGVEAPLAKTMYSNRITGPLYFGFDYGPIRPKINFPGSFQPAFFEKTDFSEVTLDQIHEANGDLADFVFSFEVFEHMTPDRLARMLLNIYTLSQPDATFVFSTPVYDHHVGAAANHINEMTVETLGAMLEAAGFEVVDRFGTFASIRDYKKELELQYGDAGLQIFDRLRQFYDPNVLSNIFGPLFPDQARNNVWLCKKQGVGAATSFSPAVLFNPDPVRRGQYTQESGWYAARQILGIEEPVRIKLDAEALEPDPQ